MRHMEKPFWGWVGQVVCSGPSTAPAAASFALYPAAPGGVGLVRGVEEVPGGAVTHSTCLSGEGPETDLISRLLCPGCYLCGCGVRKERPQAGRGCSAPSQGPGHIPTLPSLVFPEVAAE